MSDDGQDLYVAHDLDLRRIHAALIDRLGELTRFELARPVDELATKTIFVCRAMLWHHHAESAILFPHLRRTTRLRSADISFLDTCDREHRDLHDLCQGLLSSAKNPHIKAPEISTLASALSSQFSAHITEEEEGLAPIRLQEMITPSGLLVVTREVEAARPLWKL